MMIVYKSGFRLKETQWTHNTHAADLLSNVILLEHVGPIILCLISGPFSDRYGRKVPLLLSSAGMTDAYVGYGIINLVDPDFTMDPRFYLLLDHLLIQSPCPGMLYAHFGYQCVFWCSAVLNLCGMGYAALVMKMNLSNNPSSESIFSFMRLTDTIMVTFKPRDRGRRALVFPLIPVGGSRSPCPQECKPHPSSPLDLMLQRDNCHSNTTMTIQFLCISQRHTSANMGARTPITINEN